MRGGAGATGASAVAVLLLPAVPGVAKHAQLHGVVAPGAAGMGHARPVDLRADQEGHNVRTGFV